MMPLTGARMQHTVAFLEARADFWKHRDAVVSRQCLMLEIVLERGCVAKSEKLLSFSKDDRRTSQNTSMILQAQVLISTQT